MNEWVNGHTYKRINGWMNKTGNPGFPQSRLLQPAWKWMQLYMANQLVTGRSQTLWTCSRRATVWGSGCGHSHRSSAYCSQPQNPAAQPHGEPHINVVGVDVVGVWVSIQHQQPHSRMVICRERAENKGMGDEKASGESALLQSHHLSISMCQAPCYWQTRSHLTPSITLSYYPHLRMRKLRLREMTVP